MRWPRPFPAWTPPPVPIPPGVAFRLAVVLAEHHRLPAAHLPVHPAVPPGMAAQAERQRPHRPPGQHRRRQGAARSSIPSAIAVSSRLRQPPLRRRIRRKPSTHRCPSCRCRYRITIPKPHRTTSSNARSWSSRVTATTTARASPLISVRCSTMAATREPSCVMPPPVTPVTSPKSQRNRTCLPRSTSWATGCLIRRTWKTGTTLLRYWKTGHPVRKSPWFMNSISRMTCGPMLKSGPMPVTAS